MKNYILIGLAALLIGGLTGWFIKQPETKFLVGETVTVTKDTCISNSIIAQITTESSTKTSYNYKKGKPILDVSDAPIVEVTKQDSLYTTVLSKKYDYGLAKFTVTTTVKAKSAATGKFTLDFQLDTTVLKEMTTITNTVVVSKDTTDSIPAEIIKYVEVPSVKKMTYLGISGLVSKSPKTYDYSVGLSLSHGKTSVSLFKRPTTSFKSLEGYSLGINRQLVRMSAK